MIDLFESTVRTYPERVFFTYIDASGKEVSYTYRQTRLIAAAMARRLRGKGVRPGDFVSVDLPNGPTYVFLSLAAAYGSFALVAINNRLTPTEKLERLLELERQGLKVTLRVDEARARSLMYHALHPTANPRARAIMGEEQDAIDDTIHFAERAAHLFDVDARALVMFTSGTTGKSKAVELTWRNLIEASVASNMVLCDWGKDLWQAALPFYHIGGFQVIVRCVQNWSSMRVYERFDPELVLQDAAAHQATHISVVDKMLQDLLAADVDGVMANYRCVLLGGGPLNEQTIQTALSGRVRVYASYGMTETSSQIANTLITPAFKGGMRLLPGYFARIVDPDERGFGRLAVRGPGVFRGYLNAHAARTVDGYFLTGDTAALYGGELFVKERTADMFVSGGENVYPAEIAQAIRRIPGVSDAHVFGVPDEAWGRRPAAVVETAELSPHEISQALEPMLSKIYLPDYVVTTPELPHTAVGKIDRATVEELFERRLDVRAVNLYHVRLPFRKPFKTSRATLTHRDSIVVEVIDHEGRRGLGECVAFDSDWYAPEALARDARMLQQVLIPQVIGRSYLHPRDVYASLVALPGAAEAPMACCALESALWDLHARIEGKPLWRILRSEYALICEKLARRASDERVAQAFRSLPKRGSSALVEGDRAMVPAGAVVGMGSVDEVLEAVQACVAGGYRRVKLKVAPGQGLAAARAVRARFPKLLITLDANQSFGTNDIDELRAYDSLSIGWIEEPLGAGYAGRGDTMATLSRLARLQRSIHTPVCVDETYVNADEARMALRVPEIRCISLKIAKLGGVRPALEYVCRAHASGREVWLGGLYDTGISKRLHAAFQTLPGMVMPGDIAAPSRYFDTEIAYPPYRVDRGFVALNADDCPTGIGCDLDVDALGKVLVRFAPVR